MQSTKPNIRQLQFLAAACLAELVGKLGIQDAAISALLKHQIDLSTTDDLCAWDAEGTVLEITGRGDPMPERIFANLSLDQRQRLKSLIDLSTEVGVYDLFSARSGVPEEFLSKCFEIVASCSCTIPPSIMPISEYSPSCIFGSPSTADQVDEALSCHPSLLNQIRHTNSKAEG